MVAEQNKLEVLPVLRKQPEQTGGLVEKSRPVMFDLCTVWNLPLHITEKLQTYQLYRTSSVELCDVLQAMDGMLGFCGRMFVPIYQNCSRQDIIKDCASDSKQWIPSRYYWLSFRANKDFAFVLVQREIKGKDKK